jgi:hypothetical protein
MDFDLPRAVSRQAATALPASQPLRGVMCFALSRQAWTASAATTVPPGSRGPEISLLGRLIRRTTPPKRYLFTQTARADCFTPANDATQFGLSQTTLFGSDLLRNWQLLENRYSRAHMNIDQRRVKAIARSSHPISSGRGSILPSLVDVFEEDPLVEAATLGPLAARFRNDLLPAHVMDRREGLEHF